jgi:hypothetical protein
MLLGLLLALAGLQVAVSWQAPTGAGLVLGLGDWTLGQSALAMFMAGKGSHTSFVRSRAVASALFWAALASALFYSGCLVLAVAYFEVDISPQNLHDTMHGQGFTLGLLGQVLITWAGVRMLLLSVFSCYRWLFSHTFTKILKILSEGDFLAYQESNLYFCAINIVSFSTICLLACPYAMLF